MIIVLLKFNIINVFWKTYVINDDYKNWHNFKLDDNRPQDVDFIIPLGLYNDTNLLEKSLKLIEKYRSHIDDMILFDIVNDNVLWHIYENDSI